MSVSHPLCHAAPRARQDADENADDRATKDEPEVAKGVFDAFHDAGFQILRLSFSCDSSAANRQVDDLRDREDADQYWDEIEAVPEIHHAHVEAQGTRLTLLADGGKQQPQKTHCKTFDLPARACSAERGDAGNADDSEHEKIRRAEGGNQRADRRNFL